MKFLFTAFEPFGLEKKNPTMDVIQELKHIPDVDTKVLPVTFDFYEEFLIGIQDNKYDYILHLGQAGGRNKITFEKIAINYMDAPIPDNKGNKPKGVPIVQQGPDGLFTSIPIRELVMTLKQKGYPVDVSFTAGTYVCNYLMYSSLYYLGHQGTKVGFIHIPYSPMQVIEKNSPCMPTKLVVDTMKSAIDVLQNEAIYIDSNNSSGEIS